MKLTEHFDSKEFECHDCGLVKVDEDFIAKLEEARELADIPFIITSGTRCEAYNELVGGVPDSAHIPNPKTKAADILCRSSSTRWKIISALIEVGFTRIGIGANFIHVDSDSRKVPNVIWTYYGRKER